MKGHFCLYNNIDFPVGKFKLQICERWTYKNPLSKVIDVKVFIWFVLFAMCFTSRAEYFVHMKTSQIPVKDYKT